MDITDQQAVWNYIMSYQPDVVIHCAAYTKVDFAEKEPEKAFAVNRDGTRNIAKACKKLNAKMLYISTDYVFSGSGEQFHEVNDPTSPINVYGQSKLEGEWAVQECLEKYFIVRISWVFGKNGNNFVKTMLQLSESKSQLRIVADQIGSPTYTADLAPVLCDMIKSEKYGIYHVTNDGVCSWAEFADEIFKLAGKKMEIIPVTTEEYGAIAPRPKNSRLKKDEAYSMRHWRDALKSFLYDIKRD